MRLFLLFCFACFLSSSSLAQGHGAFCQQADSTAAIQSCIKRHLDSVQSRLNKVYQKFDAELKDEKLEELKELQKTWLAYRDAECMWESDRSATASAKIINELSCMARVTEDRADILTIVHSEGTEAGMRQEFGGFPRWMNVLAKDYPTTYWNYGKRSRFDLNCDGEDEYVMQGVMTARQKQEKLAVDAPEGQNLQQSFTKEIVIAVVQNPVAGRPSANVFKFSVSEEGKKETSLCSDNVVIEFGKKETKSQSDDKNKPKTCPAFVQINHKGCAPKIIAWSGKDFVLVKEDKIEKKFEKTKKK